MGFQYESIDFSRWTFSLYNKYRTIKEENWVSDEINMLINYLIDDAKIEIN